MNDQMEGWIVGLACSSPQNHREFGSYPSALCMAQHFAGGVEEGIAPLLSFVVRNKVLLSVCAGGY